MPDGYLKKQNKKIKKKKGHGASREMVENMNTIRLLYGECRATNKELKKFQKEKGRLFSRLFFAFLLSFCNQLATMLHTVLLSICCRSVHKV